MVKLLEANEVDAANEAVDIVLTEAEEAEARGRFVRNENAQDLSDGGMVGGARITPMRGGVKVAKGRAAARRAWMWNGTESVLPLAWNPDGTVHDGARKYLTKKHCLCCRQSGFRGVSCPNCTKNQCRRCGGGMDKSKIIPNFYLKKSDVPFPTKFHGDINCFLPDCVRRDDVGFLTEEEMRMHAEFKHTRQYRAYLQTKEAAKADEVAILRGCLDAMLVAQPVSEKVAQPTPAQERMAHARAAKVNKGTTKPAMA